MFFQGNFKILLTGTPLQNNLLELMSLLIFLMPDFFKRNIHEIKLLFSKCAVRIFWPSISCVVEKNLLWLRNHELIQKKTIRYKPNFYEIFNRSSLEITSKIFHFQILADKQKYWENIILQRGIGRKRFFILYSIFVDRELWQEYLLFSL